MDRTVLEGLMKRAKDKIDFRDNLRINNNYINWLEKFTENKRGFDTLALTYNSDNFTDEEQENIRNIETLYEVISEFAEKNYLKPTQVDLGNYFSIRHNNTGFYIGADWGQGVSFYCTRLDEAEEDALNYDDIVHISKLPDTMKKEERLEELSSMIDRLFNEDQFPIEVIESKVTESFQKIKNKEQ